MSKYDYPGERLFQQRCEECHGPLFRDALDNVWCPKCTDRKMKAEIKRLRRKP